MKPKHEIGVIIGHEDNWDSEGFFCGSCNWETTADDNNIPDWPELARNMLEHLQAPVPKFHISHGIGYCNYCGYSSGNAGLDITVEQVLQVHTRTPH